ncbi:hypothetical protein ACTZWW_15990 [Salinarimonas sp. NSM]|uniref:hypothetical protein n=1 Tax=Salinarimonas sp. NSM TaxID=3458003 RepID=UPI004036C1C3
MTASPIVAGPAREESREPPLTPVDIDRMLEDGPIYLRSEERIAACCDAFLSGFPGTTLYAVKANDDPRVLDAVIAAGIRDLDVASIGEIERAVRGRSDLRVHFMNPVKPAGAVRRAHREFGTRTFAVDSLEEVEKVRQATDGDPEVCLAVRLDVPDATAAVPISGKFGLGPADAAACCRAIVRNGQRPGLTFHVGGQCEEPDAYRGAIALAVACARESGVAPVLLDVGGGFPHAYANPGLTLEPYFRAVREAAQAFGTDAPPRLLCEPGRALVAPALSVLTKVTLRRGADLFVNDGYYGALSEMPLLGTRVRITATRLGRPLSGGSRAFRLFGPTCNNVDHLGDGYRLPDAVETGDWLAFHDLGAYSTAIRTNFNGLYADCFVARDRVAPFVAPFLEDA